eukprot:301441-Hanusia_phi.AAC.3
MLLYGARSRRLGNQSSAPSASSLSTSRRSIARLDASKRIGEPANRLLNRSTLRTCPPEFERKLQSSSSAARTGCCGNVAWLADNDPVSKGVLLTWWKFSSERSGPVSDSICLHGRSIDDLRVLVIYEACQVGSEAPQYSMAVAYQDGLAIYRLSTSSNVDFRVWEDLGLVAGEATALCFLEDHIIGCNTPGELFVFKDEGMQQSLEAGLEVFQQGALYQRLLAPVGKWWQGETGSSHVKSILAHKVNGDSKSSSGSNFLVFVLTEQEVFKWMLSVSESEDRSCVVSQKPISKSKSALNSVSKLVDFVMEFSYGSNNRWHENCLQVLATLDDDRRALFFLQLSDLNQLRPSQILPSNPKVGGEIKLLPPTVSFDTQPVMNLHFSSGKRLLSVRCGGFHNDNQYEDETEWCLGPDDPLLAWGTSMLDRNRHSDLILLLPTAVCAFQSSQGDLGLQGTAGIVLKILRSGAADYQILQDTAELVQNSNDEEIRSRSRLSDSRAVFLDLLREETLDLSLDPDSVLGEKWMYVQHVESKLRLFKEYRTKIKETFLSEEFAAVVEGLERFHDRLKACSSMIALPSLLPGSSFLSEAIEATVDVWEGENSLRPWAVSWRKFWEKSSKVEHILKGLRSKMAQRLSSFSQSPQPEQWREIIAMVVEASVVCQQLFSSLLREGSTVTIDAELSEELEQLLVPHMLNGDSLMVRTARWRGFAD